MKKILFTIGLFIGVSSLNAQDKSAVFSTNEVVWYGLDFSKAKFVGQFDQGAGIAPATGYEMKNKWVGQWNALIAKEQPKFDLRKAFHKDNIYYDLEPSNTFNKKMDADACMTYNDASKLDNSVIEKMIKDYPLGEKKEGIGCVFVIEKFDKSADNAVLHVTFFDIKTKKVLLCERQEGKPVGIGMRNYWAGAIKAILKQIEGNWRSWKN